MIYEKILESIKKDTDEINRIIDKIGKKIESLKEALKKEDI